MTRRSKATRTPGIVAYIRVSTDEQAVSGLGLQAQRDAITAEAARRGVPVVAVYEDAGLSGKSLDHRPGLAAALVDLDSGRGSVLMVAKLDRLSRSVHDATGLLIRADRAGWALVACDSPIDTSTAAGMAMTQIMATFAELERRLIGERTSAALRVRKAQGVRLGRPVSDHVGEQIAARIRVQRDGGASWPAIAAALNNENVPTAQGGAKWWPATVRGVYLRTAGAAAKVAAAL